jgi:hypothetical protein
VILVWVRKQNKSDSAAAREISQLRRRLPPGLEVAIDDSKRPIGKSDEYGVAIPDVINPDEQVTWG